MPLYDYECSNEHVTEDRQGYDVTVILCPSCGDSAFRHAVYLEQYMQAETGPRGGQRGAPTPRDQVDYRKDYQEFQEASQEVEHAYTKAEEETGAPIKRPDLWQQAKERSRAAFREGQIQGQITSPARST